MTERDIIRRFQDSPVPPPPEDLVARIVNDVPGEIELHPELEQPSFKKRPLIRRPMWLAAAAAMAVALTAGVTWELRKQQPSPAMMVEWTKETSQAPELADREAKAQEGISDKGTLLEAEAEMRQKADPAEDQDEAAPMVQPAIEPIVEKMRVLERLPSAPAAAPSEELGSAVLPEPKAEAPSLSLSEKKEAPTDLRQNRSEAPIRRAEGGKASLLGSTAGEVSVGTEKGRRDSSGRVSEREELDDYNAFSSEIVILGERDEVVPAPSAIARVLPSAGGVAEPNDQPYGDVFFEHSGVNPFVDSEDDALSTFGLDVDTGSYSIARRYLRDGNLPPASAIRVEEFVNALDYGDDAPRRDDFRLAAEGAPSIFAPGERYYTLRFAIKAREVDAADRPSAVLVFCVDISGSMDRENRLGLVKQALLELLSQLRSDDRVGLVVYGSRGEILLEPTIDHELIRRAIQRLEPGGSTNAEEGLTLAYGLLDRFNDGPEDKTIRRVILCSDGVANVGRTGPESILARIQTEATEGIELTTVGFGMGNYNDTMMEQLANAGDGRYAYVDDLAEARRIFVEQLTGTLLTIGREAKAQVEFDPQVVSRWRLLGYENRDIADERFRDPTVDAGEIGAGHTVTALYEVKLLDDLSRRDTVATLRMRYRPQGSDRPVEVEQSIRVGDLEKRWSNASPAFKLASLVVEFAEVLKKTYWSKDVNLREVEKLLREIQDRGRFGQQLVDLIAMVSRAADLQQPQPIGETDME